MHYRSRSPMHALSAASGPKLEPSLEDIVRCECRHGRGGLQCRRYIRFDPEYEMQICESCYYENRADRPRCRCNCPNCHDYDSNWESVQSVPRGSAAPRVTLSSRKTCSEEEVAGVARPSLEKQLGDNMENIDHWSSRLAEEDGTDRRFSSTSAP